MKTKVQQNPEDKPVTEKRLKVVLKSELKKALKGVHGRMDGFDKRMDGFDKRMDGFDKRMDGFDKRMDGFDKRMDKMDKKIDDRFDSLKNYIDWKHDSLKEEIFAVMYTKQDHAKFMEFMEKAMKEIKASQYERTVSGHRFADLDDRVDDHEKRLRVLEA